jgi:hypothetical protein
MIRFARILVLAVVALTLTPRLAAAVCCVESPATCGNYTSCSNGVDGSCPGGVSCGDVCDRMKCYSVALAPGLTGIGGIAVTVLILSLGTALAWRQRDQHGV